MVAKEERVYNFESKIINKIKKYISAGKYDNALALITSLSYLEYDYNQKYVNEILEMYILQIADKILINSPSIERDKNIILFYDAFGLNSRGLAQIYVKALSTKYKVLYITRENNLNNIPDIIDIVNANNGYVYGLKQISRKKRIIELFTFIEKYRPSNLFMYTQPDDTVSTVVFSKYQGIATRFQVNLTDHAYWLGNKVLDYCIEFRDYGGCVSKYYRMIDEKKIIKLPYYPIINYEQEFEGYPFDAANVEFVFSGGTLYKTISEDNKYYQIVEYILEKYPKVVFWYAGSGNGYDYKLIDLEKKYPERVYWTRERKDLYQILKRCVFYLNTYPMVGGLMMQYAAMAGKVPVTLKYDACSEGILFDQNNLKIEFSDDAEVKKEIDRLFESLVYREKKGRQLQKAVISPVEFEYQLIKIVEEHKTDYSILYEQVDVKKFIENDYVRFNERKLGRYIAVKDNLCLFKCMPFTYMEGIIYRIINRIKKKRVK